MELLHETSNTIIPNSYQKPNFYSDELCYWLTTEEYVVLDFVIRRILGFESNRVSKRDRVSISQICNGIRSKKDGRLLSRGTGLSRPAVINALNSLNKFNIISKIGDPTNDGQEYELNIDKESIDIHGLVQRKSESKKSDKKRTTKARNILNNVGGQSDLPPTEITRWSVGLTAGGQSDLPQVVSRTDTQNKLKTNIKQTFENFPNSSYATSDSNSAYADENNQLEKELWDAIESPNDIHSEHNDNEKDSMSYASDDHEIDTLSEHGETGKSNNGSKQQKVEPNRGTNNVPGLDIKKHTDPSISAQHKDRIKTALREYDGVGNAAVSDPSIPGKPAELAAWYYLKANPQYDTVKSNKSPYLKHAQKAIDEFMNILKGDKPTQEQLMEIVHYAFQNNNFKDQKIYIFRNLMLNDAWVKIREGCERNRKLQEEAELLAYNEELINKKYQRKENK